MKKYIHLCYLVFGLLLLTGCKVDNGESLNAVGSSAMQPLVEAAGEQYSSENFGKFINVQGGGSGTGLSQVQSGAVEIGNSDLFAEEKSGIKAEDLVDHKVAVVGTTPIVNKEVGLTDISLSDLKKVFTGKVTNWKEIGGNDLEVVIINRASGSGSRQTFESAVLGSEQAVKSQEQDSTGMVRQIVSTTPGAISYVAFSYVTDEVHALSIDQIKGTDENVMTNKWPIWSYEHMYTKGKPTGLTAEFLEYMVSDEIQGKVVPQLGYIPVSQMKVERHANGETTSVIK